MVQLSRCPVFASPKGQDSAMRRVATFMEPRMGTAASNEAAHRWDGRVFANSMRFYACRIVRASRRVSGKHPLWAIGMPRQSA